jgi:hypothetical protein
MIQGERFNSIDILKGFMVLFILFAGALYMPETLPVFSDSTVKTPSHLISEWAVISFVFMYGMTVPFMISKKINDGKSSYEIVRAIFSKTLVFLVIGVLMVNVHRIDAALSGFNSYVYSIILFCGIFLVWFRYPDEEGNFFTVTGLRLLGLAMLIFILFKFKSGSYENSGSLVTGWWELPGLTGWAFLVTAFTYLAFRNSFIGTTIIWIGFLLLRIFSGLGMTSFLNPVQPFIGPLTDGCFPFIMLSGSMASIILKKYSEAEFNASASRLAIYGALSLAGGIALKFTLTSPQSGINPSVILIVNGIVILVFLFFHWLADIKKFGYMFGAFRHAGENYFTAYLFPFLIYNLLFVAGVDVFFFRQYGPVVNILASFGVAAVMMALSLLAIKLNIRLKI